MNKIPEKVIDVHAYYDESRINIEGYLKLLDNFKLAMVVLSPPCTHVYEPDKSPIMYKVQRELLWRDWLRPMAAMVSASFYNKAGELRGIWRLFTRGNKKINKAMHPDNARLEELIKKDLTRLGMWYWINPKDLVDLKELKEKLSNPQVIGLKFHAYWHTFSMDKLKPYMELCHEMNLPVYLILGFGPSGDYDYVLKHYCKNKIIFGYGGFPYFRKVWTRIKEIPNAYIDFTSFHLDQRMIRNALKVLGPGKCLFGSDCPYNYTNSKGEFDYSLAFSRLGFESLSSIEQEQIYCKNFEYLINPINS